ncbi:hypothetical protein HK100_002295 [Physocladia obscura]|uniref:UspA domain-containing protein n=1 Tax=Physocladia obscura TaxID=109957 RepID=A0AAD5XAC4_9FUNG|nr:hypothetical protein HK100_002295 [Physocladia obscura]
MATAPTSFVDETTVIDYQKGDYARTVVICVDNSEVSARAVKWATDHVLRPDDLIVFLHCHPPYLLEQEALGLKENAKQILLSRANILPPEFSKVRAISLLNVSVGFRLFTKITEISPEFVVCGTRGEGPLSKALHGSVSDYLVHTCECSVIVPKPATAF